MRRKKSKPIDAWIALVSSYYGVRLIQVLLQSEILHSYSFNLKGFVWSIRARLLGKILNKRTKQNTYYLAH